MEGRGDGLQRHLIFISESRTWCLTSSGRALLLSPEGVISEYTGLWGGGRSGKDYSPLTVLASSQAAGPGADPGPSPRVRCWEESLRTEDQSLWLQNLWKGTFGLVRGAKAF